MPNILDDISDKLDRLLSGQREVVRRLDRLEGHPEEEGPPELGESPDAIDLGVVTFLHHDISDWPIRGRVKRVEFEPTQLGIDHTTSGTWPKMDIGRAGSPIIIEGNPWVIAKVDGQWFAATYEWLRPGQVMKGVHAANIGEHIKTGALRNWRPLPGELVYFMVSTPARDKRRTIRARTNVVAAQWGTTLRY